MYVPELKTWKIWTVLVPCILLLRLHNMAIAVTRTQSETTDATTGTTNLLSLLPLLSSAVHEASGQRSGFPSTLKLTDHDD